MQIRLYCSKLLETTVHQFCEKPLHITFNVTTVQEPLHRENQVRVRKIFVGGLKETTDESILSEYFSQFGHVDHVDLIEDRATKRLRGFAYVTFNDYDPVDKAVCK